MLSGAVWSYSRHYFTFMKWKLAGVNPAVAFTFLSFRLCSLSVASGERGDTAGRWPVKARENSVARWCFQLNSMAFNMDLHVWVKRKFHTQACWMIFLNPSLRGFACKVSPEQQSVSIVTAPGWEMMLGVMRLEVSLLWIVWEETIGLYEIWRRGAGVCSVSEADNPGLDGLARMDWRRWRRKSSLPPLFYHVAGWAACGGVKGCCYVCVWFSLSRFALMMKIYLWNAANGNTQVIQWRRLFTFSLH